MTVKVSPDYSGSLMLVTISPYMEGSAVYRLENLSKKVTLIIRQRYKYDAVATSCVALYSGRAMGVIIVVWQTSS